MSSDADLHDVKQAQKGAATPAAIIAYAKTKKTLRARICHTAKKYSVKALADALGVNYSHIYNVCKGQRDISPTLFEAMEKHGLGPKQPRPRYGRTWHTYNKEDIDLLETALLRAGFDGFQQMVDQFIEEQS